MAALDELFRTMASALTKAFGSTALMRKTTTVYNQDTGAETVSEQTLTVPCTPPEPFETVRIDGDLIVASDLRVCVPASDLKLSGVETIPSPEGWTLAFAGTVYNVLRIAPYYSGDQAALLELQLRN